MSAIPKDQVLPTQITDRQVAVLVAQALRQAHAASDAVVKRIARATQTSATTVRKWYEGQNAPSSANLLTLMSTYDGMFQTVLHLLGRDEMLETSPKGRDAPLTQLRQVVYGDRFVTINVVVSAKAAPNLNQRQLWFLGQLQDNKVVRVEDLAEIWGKSLRTAKRDIQGLKVAGLVRFSGGKRNGRYRLV